MSHEHGQGHDHDHGHDDGPPPGFALDPVCGMTVDKAAAEARGLHVRHDGVDYWFCGRGCKLDFAEDPGQFLDPSYKPSM